MVTPGQSNAGVTGAFTYSVPINAPPGTAGVVPALSLGYSSQATDGIVGYGWSLNGLPTIVRCPRSVADDTVHGGVNYDSNDRFCLGSQKLSLVSGTYGADLSQYRTLTESFSKIIAHGTAGNGPAWFEVHLKSGQVLEFGNTADSQILAVGKTTARAWAIDKFTDVKGNYYTVTYTDDSTNGQFYPTRVDYTGNTAQSLATYNSVRFSYTTRGDIVPTYQVGSLIKTTVVLTDVKTYAGATMVTDYKLAYRTGTSTLHSRLTSITQCDTSGTTCLAPTSFGWQGGTGLPTMTSTANGIGQGGVNGGVYSNGLLLPADFNADGLIDVAAKKYPYNISGCGIYTSSSSGTFTLSTIDVAFPDWTIDNETHQWVDEGDGDFCEASQRQVGFVDFHADGYSDGLASGKDQNEVQAVFPLTNNKLGRVYGNYPIELSNYQVGDFDGDSLDDVIDTTYGHVYLQMTTPSSLTITPSTTMLVGDFDGDGCSDILDQGTVNAVYYSCNPATASVSVSNFTGSEVVLGDFNGDGKTDVLIAKTATTGTLYLSTGTGLVATSFSVPSGWGKYAIFTGDFDGDGKTDLALIAPGSTGMYGPTTSHQIWLSTGSGFVQATTISNTNSSDTTVAASIADWNNDGADEIWLQKPSGDTIYKFAYVPELMTSVSNGIGATTTVTYDRLNKNGTFYTKGTTATYPTRDLDGAYYVVSEIDTNGGSGTHSLTYAYAGGQSSASSPQEARAHWQVNGTPAASAGPRSNLLMTGFLGFMQITTTDLQTNLVTTTNFRTDAPYLGMVASQTVTDGATTLSSATNTYAATNLGGTANFVYLTQAVTTANDLNGAALPTVTVAYTYDTYGNPLTITQSLSDGSSNTTTNTFTNDTTDWVLGQLATSNVQSIVGTSNLTRHVSFGHDATTGLLTQQVLEPSTSALKLQADIGYDAFGNRNSVMLSGVDITTRTSSIGFDTKGEFVTSSTNALSQGQSSTYNANFGTSATHTDLNSVVTNWSYDTFGRQTLETRPDSNKTSVSYLYCSGVNGGSATCPTGGAYLMQTTPYASNGTTQNGAQSKVYYDASSRVIAIDLQAFDGTNWIRQSTQYDAAGRVSQTSRPYFVTGGTAKWTVYTYDDLSRATQATFPDTSKTTYGYNGLTSTVTNDKSQVTTTIRNAQGLVASVKDALDAGDPGHHTTSYVYDAFGNLTTITDPSSNATTYTYDLRGRKTAASDPDMGNWTYGYDVLSELTSQTDAKSQGSSLTYDLLGRPLTRVEADLSSKWTYDTATKGKGNLAQACATSTCLTSGYIRTPAYDTLGRPSSTALQVDSTAYTYGVAYNSDGRLDTVTYPSGFVAKYVYTSLGYLSQIKDNSSGSVLWTANTRDAELHLLTQTAGNSVVTTQVFDANTGNVQQVRAGTSNSVANLSFGWDTIGNVTSRSDTIQSLSETFGYDVLNRLTSYQVNTNTAKSVTYDALGNITKKSDVCNTANCFAYGAGAPGPHALTSITGTYNGVTNPTFAYDANGNLTSGGGRTLTYTSFNMTATITQGATSLALVYDSEHDRIKQCVPNCTSPTAVTNYLNDPVTGTMEEKYVSGSTTTWHDYINAGGGIVAERFNTAGTVTWRYFVLDHLGSTSALTDGAGTVQERLSYDAWGKRRNANGSDNATCSITSATTRGFTGHEEMDAQCLINANARVYDPSLGRFASADTVTPDAFNGQSWNRFSYVNNGPLSATDPTGHLTGDCPQCNYTADPVETVTVTASKDHGGMSGSFGGSSAGASGGERSDTKKGGEPIETVTVTATKWQSAPPPNVKIISPSFLLLVPAAPGVGQNGKSQDSCPVGKIASAARSAIQQGSNTQASGDYLTLGGTIVAAGGALTAQPEAVASGATGIVVGQVFSKVGLGMQVFGGAVLYVEGDPRPLTQIVIQQGVDAKSPPSVPGHDPSDALVAAAVRDMYPGMPTC